MAKRSKFLKTPWYGSRQMARHLRRQGYSVGRKRIRGHVQPGENLEDILGVDGIAGPRGGLFGDVGAPAGKHLIGISTAWWGREFSIAFGKMPATLRAATPLFLIGIFLAARRLLPIGTAVPIYNAIELACAAPIVVLLYHGAWRPSLLSTPAITTLGDISYSVYVLHFPIMYLMVQLMVGALSGMSGALIGALTCALVVATATVTLGLAMLTYRYVERPFIELGRATSMKCLRPAAASAN